MGLGKKVKRKFKALFNGMQDVSDYYTEKFNTHRVCLDTLTTDTRSLSAQMSRLSIVVDKLDTSTSSHDAVLKSYETTLKTLINRVAALEKSSENRSIEKSLENKFIVIEDLGDCETEADYGTCPCSDHCDL
jgi:predicted ATP-binding protein involved in virulence